MGLKTINYTIEENGLTLPEAYAYIRNISVYDDKGSAEFVVQTNREKAINLTALKTVHIEFDVNRNENPYVTAYNKAKSAISVNRGTHVVRVEMPFYGWEDDLADET